MPTALLTNRLPLCSNQGKIPRKLLLVIVVIVAAMVTGAFFLRKQSSGNSSAASVEAPRVTLLPLDEFIVNLADRSENHYLSVTITLEVTEPSPTEDAKSKQSAHQSNAGHSSAGEEHLSDEASDELTPRIRDAVIEVLTCQTYPSLRTREGRAKLKTAIKDNVNAKVDSIRVVNVLFSTFVIQ